MAYDPNKNYIQQKSSPELPSNKQPMSQGYNPTVDYVNKTSNVTPTKNPIKKQKKQSFLKRAEQTGGDLAAQFAIGLGNMSGALAEQLAFGVPSFLANIRAKKKELLASGVGILGETVLKDEPAFNNFTDKLEKRLTDQATQTDAFRKQIQEIRNKVSTQREKGVEILTQPLTTKDTMAGQVAGAVGGMVPFIASKTLGAPLLALSVSETMLNVEDSYNTNIENGMDQEKAQARAVAQGVGDFAFTYITNRFGALNKIGGAPKVSVDKSSLYKMIDNVTEYLKDVGLETAQEVWQTGLSNMATDRPFTENLSETAKVSFFASLFFAGAGSIANLPTKVKDKTTQTIEEINTKVAEGKQLNELESQIYLLTNGENPFTQERMAQEEEFDVQAIADEIKAERNIDQFLVRETPEDEAKFKVEQPEDNLTTSIQKAKASGQSFDEWVSELGIKEIPSKDSRLLYHVSETPNITELRPQANGSRGVFVTPGEPSRSNGFVYAIDRTKLPEGVLKQDPSQARDFYIDGPVPKKAMINMGQIKQGRLDKVSQLKAEWDKVNTSPKKPALPTYKGEKDLTTKILKDLEGKTTVSKQYILDATNRPELKQVERDLIRDIVSQEGDVVNVNDFAKKVKAELLPLKRKTLDKPLYESITLPDKLRGNVANYYENLYELPVELSDNTRDPLHFKDINEKMYGWTRVEDMADGKTRRVIEVQNYITQKAGKDRLTKELEYFPSLTNEQREVIEKSGKSISEKNAMTREIQESLRKEKSKIAQYGNPESHFRKLREEIKKAAQDGKTKLQFPTGETAMKIEGLGTQGDGGMMFAYEGFPIEPETLKVGRKIYSEASDQDWVITEVLGNGKFRAIPKELADNTEPEALASTGRAQGEMFDISGEIDTNNPIYKFYEKDVQKYLNKFGGKRVTDAQGVQWIEVPITKEMGKMPVEAFKVETEEPTKVSAVEGLIKIKEYQERLGVQFPVKVYEKIYTGNLKDGRPQTALGMFLDNQITLAEYITEFTADHETVHFAMQNLSNIPVFKGLTADAIFNQLQKKYLPTVTGELTSEQKYFLEERLAEDYETYAMEMQTGKKSKFVGKVREFMDRLYQAFLDLLNINIGDYSSIQRFYDKLYFGSNKNVISFQNTGKTSEFMTRRFKEFGEEPVKFQTEGYRPEKTTTRNVETKYLKQGERKGIKIGRTIEKRKTREEIERSRRQAQLATLQDRITKRLYTKSILEELKTSIPRDEWSRFMNRLTAVGTSEAQYLNLIQDIGQRKQELDEMEGMRRDKALMRQKIGYLKHVFDIEPSLVLDIKKQLNIRGTYKKGERAGQLKKSLKSIKNYNLDELNILLEELNRRIEFRKNNQVSYLDLSKVKGGESFVEKVIERIKKTDRALIAPMERTLRKASNVLNESVMTYEFEKNRQSEIRATKLDNLMDIYNKMSDEDKEAVKLTAESGKITQLRATLEQYATEEEVDVALENSREVLDEIQKELNEVGVNVPYRRDFFPRKLKPLDVDSAELLLKQFEYKLGRQATQEERTYILNNLMRGFDMTRIPVITLSGKKFESQRLIETITPELSYFYEDFKTSLMSYVLSATQVIESRKFFGKFNIDNLDYDASIENSIGAKLYDLYNKGVISKKDIPEITKIMKAIFIPNNNSFIRAIQQITNDYVYPLTIGQIGSMVTQIKDLSMQVLIDVFQGQFNVIGSQRITLEDIYQSKDFRELDTESITSENAVAKIGQKILSPFSKTDKFFLQVFVNASSRRLVKLAKANNKTLRQNIYDIFGEQKGQEVFEQLQSQDIKDIQLTEELNRLIFSEVARIRPLTPLQKARASRDFPFMYTLKNFMIKQLEFVRRESFDVIADGVQKKDAKIVTEGMARLGAILTVLGLLGAGVDELKDFIRGRNKDSFKDKVFNNLIGIVGLNSYMLEFGSPLDAITPATASVLFSFGKDAVQDVKDTIDGDPIYEAKVLRRFPLVGDLFYYRVGGGNK